MTKLLRQGRYNGKRQMREQGLQRSTNGALEGQRDPLIKDLIIKDYLY